MKKLNSKILVGVATIIVIAIVVFAQMSQNIGPKVSGNIIGSSTPAIDASLR